MGNCSNNPKVINENENDNDNDNKNVNKEHNKVIKSNQIQVPNRAKFKTIKLSLSKSESKEKDILTFIRKNNNELKDFNILRTALINQLFLKNLHESSIKEIVKLMSYVSVKKGINVFSQNSIGLYFYIVKEGSLQLSINDKALKLLGPGDYFGELALLHDAPRSGTITTKKDCFLYCLEGSIFRNVLNEINHLNFEKNKKFVDSIPLLNSLENEQKMILIQNLVEEGFKEEKTVIEEGEIGTCFYIIKEGEVECLSKGRFIRKLSVGEFFGEKCMLHDFKRTVSVRTITPCVLYSVSMDTLKAMLGEKFKDFLVFNSIKDCLKKTSYLKYIGEEIIENIHDKMKLIYYENAKVVLSTGYIKSSKIMIILDGRIINESTKEVYERGTLLFEKEIISKSESKLSGNLIANPDCFLGVSDTMVLNQSLTHDPINSIMDRFGIRESLKNIQLFKNLSEAKLNKIIEKIKIEQFSDKQIVITQGSTSEKFYIVKSGAFDVFINEKYTRTLNFGQYFGERSLFFSEPRSATVKSKGLSETYSLDQSDFKTLIEEGLKNYLISRLALQDSVELSELEYMKELGSGGFGKVYLVKSNKSQYCYALKSIIRKKVDNEDLHIYLEREKNILLSLNHPFIVKLVNTLGDESRIYFLMEYVRGKELWEVIREIGLLTKSQTLFYGGSLILAIDYMQKKNFVHRDLKPENVIVCENGYIKLIDFGTAKKIIDRTSTIIGSPHYMAPEVILGKGYSFSVDIWSISVIIFEFLCGGVPFGNEAKDPMEIYTHVVNSELKIPNFIKDKDFADLMTRLLDKSPVSRLSRIGVIQKHEYFKSLDWNKLYNLEIKAPYLQRTRNSEFGNENVMNFSEYIKKQEINIKETKTLSDKVKKEFEEWHKKF